MFGGVLGISTSTLVSLLYLIVPGLGTVVVKGIVVSLSAVFIWLTVRYWSLLDNGTGADTAESRTPIPDSTDPAETQGPNTEQ